MDKRDEKLRKEHIVASIDKNSIQDKGNGYVEFKGGLTLSDESVMKSGTKYDIKSMDIDNWDGTVFADHDYSISAIVGNAVGVTKRGKRLVAEGVQFAVNQSPLANYVYQMVLGGFVKAVSIGTIGRVDELSDEEQAESGAWGVYRNSRLIEFSFVGIGNNDNAVVNSIAKNVFEGAKAQGLDTKELEQWAPVKAEITNKESNSMTEEEKRASEAEAARKKAEAEEEAAKRVSEANAEMIKNAVAAATAPLMEKLDATEKIAKEAFDKSAKEPEFTPTSQKNGVTTIEAELNSMDWRERAAAQVQSFYDYKIKGNQDSFVKLNQINEFHKKQLVEAGKISKNALTAADFGNFVTSPEQITQIEGYRTDYSQLLQAFPYRQTNSLQMAWLTRDGDIDMQPLAGIFPTDGNPDANLKPVSEYGATPHTKDLEELAAVTPIVTAATLFLAVDLIEDAGQGYRNSYDRNKARGIIAALELAAEDNDGASYGFTAAGVDTASEQLGQIRKAFDAISQGEGIAIINEASHSLLWSLAVELGNGGVLTNSAVGDNPVNRLWGKRVVVVPNDLMPTLGEAGTKTISYEGATVTVNHGMFYVNPTNVRARENGGLRYDLSTDAAYEIGGEVRSAFQRNEVVLRGSHFRGTAVLDPSRVGAVRALNVIS